MDELIINYEWRWVGRDLLVLITGGKEHLGSVSSKAFSFSFPGHRDSVISDAAAASISAALNTNCVVLCGIHFDNITREQIEEVVRKGEKLAEAVIAECSAGLQKTGRGSL